MARRHAGKAGGHGAEAAHGKEGSGGSKSPKKTKGKRRKAGKRRLDRHAMYQRAVQEPEADIEFLERVYGDHFGRRPCLLREDFCGTAWLACEWARQSPDHRAWGVDLDPEPLAWCAAHNLPALDDDQRARVTLVEGDVLDVRPAPVDIVVAFNFSYFVFTTRPRMLAYFRACRRNLRRQGLLVIDIYGGPDAQHLLEETTEHDDFDYVWDQDEFDAIGQRMRCYIHFRKAGKASVEKAFRYDWRLWSIVELREALQDAGFRSTEVYWEGLDEETGEGDGVFTRTEQAENTDSWVAYIVAVR